MQDDDDRNRAQLAAFRLELARELERFGVSPPATDASTEAWDRFLADARAVARIDRPDLLGLLCLVGDVLRCMEECARLPPPQGAFVRMPGGELLCLFVGDSAHDRQ